MEINLLKNTNGFSLHTSTESWGNDTGKDSSEKYGF